ncbi:MAG: CBS domain-containing protein [Anaerolineales bacterium]|nr:CBS domain-containing protein [Anaerolineales bacterium]
MNISDCMKRNVVSISVKATVREAAAIFVRKHVGVLPVVDKSDKPVGVVGLRDLLSLELPVFVNFIADVDYVHDFGAVEDTHPSAKTLNQSVKAVMKDAVVVDEDCGLLRAYALMLQHNLHDITVVDKNGKLSGIASRVDVGISILNAWAKIK